MDKKVKELEEKSGKFEETSQRVAQLRQGQDMFKEAAGGAVGRSEVSRPTSLHPDSLEAFT